MQTGESFQRPGDAVDPDMLQALPELPALEFEVFHDDQSLAILRIPVGVIESGRGYVE